MGQLSITAIDVLVVIVVVASAGYAFFRGLVHETFAILEWVASGYAALRFTPVFQPMLRDYISPLWLEWVAVFLGTFLIVFIPLSIMSHRLSQVMMKSAAGPIDRTLGFVFGVGRGLVIVGLAYLAFSSFVAAKDQPDALTKARLYPLIRSTSEVLRSLSPPSEDDENSAKSTTNASSEPAAAKTYGADDRSALDRLFETSGGGGNPAR
jgi:membrane protein required for colicin V production